MKKFTVVAVLTAALVSPAARAADVTEADFQKAMKEVLGGMQAIGRTLREGTGELSGAAVGAKAIDAALATTESYWVSHKVQDAVDMNKKAREAALAVVKAAESKDAAATAEAQKGLQAACKPCHDAHREQLPDKSYKIK